MELEFMSELEKVQRAPQMERALSDEDRAYHRIVMRSGMASMGKSEIQL